VRPNAREELRQADPSELNLQVSYDFASQANACRCVFFAAMSGGTPHRGNPDIAFQAIDRAPNIMANHQLLCYN